MWLDLTMLSHDVVIASSLFVWYSEDPFLDLSVPQEFFEAWEVGMLSIFSLPDE